MAATPQQADVVQGAEWDISIGPNLDYRRYRQEPALRSR